MQQAALLAKLRPPRLPKVLTRTTPPALAVCHLLHNNHFITHIELLLHVHANTRKKRWEC